jgi:threonine dehydratase
MKIIVEPSCAVTLAVAIKYKDIFKGKSIALILTGGNVDLEDTKNSFTNILNTI